MPPLLKGRENGRYTESALTGRKPSGRNLIAAASSLPLGLVPGATSPDVLHGFKLEAAQAHAAVPLPVPSDTADDHVADDGCLESLP